MHHICDLILLTHCPDFLQEIRLKGRPSLPFSLKERLLERHMPFSQKKAKAHILIATGLNKHHTWREFTEKVLNPYQL